MANGLASQWTPAAQQGRERGGAFTWHSERTYCTGLTSKPRCNAEKEFRARKSCVRVMRGWECCRGIFQTWSLLCMLCDMWCVFECAVLSLFFVGLGISFPNCHWGGFESVSMMFGEELCLCFRAFARQ